MEMRTISMRTLRKRTGPLMLLALSVLSALLNTLAMIASYYCLLMLLALSNLSACATRVEVTDPVTILPDGPCIASFDAFAFSTPDLDGPTQEVILPLEPWQVETSLPETAYPDQFRVGAVRTFGDAIEVWLQIPVWFSEVRPYRFLVYRSDTKAWRDISPQIENGLDIVDRLFVSEDGAIWGRGRTSWGSELWPEERDLVGKPALSRYNETTQHFEHVQTTDEIPIGRMDTRDTNAITHWNEVLMDSRGVFWFFVFKDAIYSYNPASQEVARHAELSEFDAIHQIALAPDGSIYFTSYGAQDVHYLQDGQIFQFLPATGEIKPVEIPRQRWPPVAWILVDHSGRLWLDTFGWREPDGEWHRFHPQMSRFMRVNAFLDLWKYYWPPRVFLESSDGRLWFRIDRSSDQRAYKTGIAWYDPETREGCWFTSEGTNIFEDGRQVLWLATAGKLYRYPLEP